MIRTAGKSHYSVLFMSLFFSILFHAAFAQKNNPLVNSGEVLKKGKEQVEAQQYKNAIAEFKKINRSDTNYSEALYQLAYCSSLDSQAQAAYQYAEEGIRLFPTEFYRFIILEGNALDDMKKSDEAIAAYNRGLEKNPNAAVLYFDKGIAYKDAGKMKEAMDNFQQALLIDPYYYSAHYYVGALYEAQGNLVPAMLALQTYLLLAPQGKYSNRSLQLLQNISKVTDDVRDSAKKYKPSKEDNYDIQQQILLSKASLDPQYKLKADLDDPMVRQMQVVSEKLQYNKNDKGFSMQFYVPLYQKLFAEDDFEPMIFSLFSGLNIKQVDSWLKRNKKRTDEFGIKAAAYLDQIRGTRILELEERTKATPIYLFSDGQLIGKGKYEKTAKAFVISGPWEFYYPNGILKAKGTFSQDGKKEGLWEYYYENGEKKEKNTYKDDILDGPSEGWFNNGIRRYATTYRQGKLNGEYDAYYYSGNTKLIEFYKDDKRNGTQKNYNNKGQLSYSINYTEDKQEGLARAYYPDGHVMKEINYKNDKAEGTYKEYTEESTLLKKGDYVSDLRQGLWVSYYKNGVKRDEITYKDGEITGEFTEYYDNGKLSSRGNYTKKKIDGKLEEYDDDGKLCSDAVYDKGRLKEINFYNKAGAVISTTTTRKGAATIAFYSPEGDKTGEGYFNKDGDKDGLYTTYYRSGKIKEKAMYKAGVKDGTDISYYPSGQVKMETGYVNGDEDGYEKRYFDNGKLYSEGWMVKGEKQQQFIYYNVLGDTVKTAYFLDDDNDGYEVYRYPGHHLDCEYRYYKGWVQSVAQYDTTNKVIMQTDFKQGKGPLLFSLPVSNGKKLAEGSYDHYELNGVYKRYYPDGSLTSVIYYDNGLYDSAYKSFYYGGKVTAEGRYRKGDKEGAWKYYYDNGQLSEVEIYKDGDLDSLDYLYHPDGTLDKVYSFKRGNKEGPYKIYGENNQLAVMLYYKEDEITGYSYEDKEGNLVPVIPIKKATGKIVGYYRNGTKSIEMDLQDNLLEGPRTLYYTNGKLCAAQTLLDGLNNGPRKLYYPDGTLKQEEVYVLDDLQGVKKTYYPNGKLKSEENYYADDLNGTCKYYNDQGKLVQTRTYYYTLLLSVQ